MHGFTRWWINALPHRWYLGRHVPAFLKKSPEPFRGEVLEIGAGSGWTSQQILETFPQVELTATDIDASAHDKFDELRRKYGRRLSMREANVLQLPFDRDAFDIVLAMNVIPYLPPYAVRKAIQEMLRVTRPGGLIGMSDHGLFGMDPGSRDLVMEALSQEDCTVVYDNRKPRYDIWVQNPYPVRKD